jgi:malonyl-CoA O-methyltransferase
MKRRIIYHFNRGAKTYDSAAAVQIKIANRLAARLQNIEAKQILEIGCGTGLLSQQLLAAFPKASILLTDISSSMIEICDKRFAEYSQIKSTCMDGENLKLDSSFDLMTSSMAMHWFQNFERSINQLIQRLKPGGRLVFSMLAENSLREWREMCKQFNMAAGVQKFPVVETLQTYFPELNIEVEIFQHSYDNAFAFLNSLKQLGANATDDHYVATPLSKMRELLRCYSSEVKMTYEVIYGSYTK